MSKVPDALERRELLYGRPKRAPNFAELGEGYLAAGRLADALEAFDRLPDRDERRARIAKLRDEAVKDGTVFLLERIAALDAVDAAQWRDASAAAEQAGKLRYALTAARKAGDAERVAKLEQSLGIAKPAPVASSDEGAKGESGEDEA